jgi:hypothetical protein
MPRVRRWALGGDRSRIDAGGRGGPGKADPTGSFLMETSSRWARKLRF